MGDLIYTWPEKRLLFEFQIYGKVLLGIILSKKFSLCFPTGMFMFPLC